MKMQILIKLWKIPAENDENKISYFRALQKEDHEKERNLDLNKKLVW